MIVEPKDIDEWKEEIEIEAFKQAIKSSLENFELIAKTKQDIENAFFGKDILMKLVFRIVDNLQINVKNIHIIFQD